MLRTSILQKHSTECILDIPREHTGRYWSVAGGSLTHQRIFRTVLLKHSAHSGIERSNSMLAFFADIVPSKFVRNKLSYSTIWQIAFSLSWFEVYAANCRFGWSNSELTCYVRAPDAISIKLR